jgi:hypothetical protein
MDSGPASHDLLRHFDQPKTFDLPDFEWVDEVIPLDSVALASHGIDVPERADRFIELPRDTRHGIDWVLAWAAALVVLGIAAGVLLEFAYLIAAERTLTVAARAGVMEATLPRATYQSVIAAIDRRLLQYPLLAKQLNVCFLQNGALVQSQFRQQDGDCFAVRLSGPGSAAVPNWLRTLMFWRVESKITAQAERQSPGRKLAYGAVLPTRR